LTKTIKHTDMLKYGSLTASLALMGNAIELQSQAQLELQAELEAMVEQEHYSAISTAPCAFPNVT